jgi:hypothetical protein
VEHVELQDFEELNEVAVCGRNGGVREATQLGCSHETGTISDPKKSSSLKGEFRSNCTCRKTQIAQEITPGKIGMEGKPTNVLTTLVCFILNGTKHEMLLRIGRRQWDSHARCSRQE